MLAAVALSMWQQGGTVPGTRHSTMDGTWHMAQGTWHSGYGTQNMAQGMWHRAFGTVYMAQGIWHRAHNK